MLKYEMEIIKDTIELTNNFDECIENIIKKMDKKRGHEKNLTAEEVKEKIYSTNPNKPGEYFEFMEEYNISNGELTPDLALEMADIVYYTSQPNCPDNIKPLVFSLEEMIGINHQLAQRFCILKYESRLKESNYSRNYKKHEKELMIDFFETNLQK